MAPSPARRPCWMDGSATVTMKKSKTNMNVPVISTASADQRLRSTRPGSDARGSDWTERVALVVVVMLPSLVPPLRGESRRGRVEDGPADFGPLVLGGSRLGERGEVVLADGPVHPDGPFGHHGAQPAVRLVEVSDRAGVEHHRRLHAGNGQRPDPSGGRGQVIHGNERGQLGA